MNTVEISGIVVQRLIGHSVIKTTRASAINDFIMVWDLPESYLPGTLLTICGKVDCRELYSGSKKKVLGVKAEQVISFNGNHKVEVSGKITAKASTIRVSPKGKIILDLTVRIDGKPVPVVTWGPTACWAHTTLVPGDEVKISGLIFSRKYDVTCGDRTITKRTTELNVREIEKIEK